MRQQFSWALALIILLMMIPEQGQSQSPGPARIGDISCNTRDFNELWAILDANVRVSTPADLPCTLRVRGPEGSDRDLFFKSEGVEVDLPLTLTVKSPQKWMPRGMGEARLYEFSFELICGGESADKKTLSYGIRTVEKIDLPEQETFHLRINDASVFLKAAQVSAPLEANEAAARVETAAKSGLNLLIVRPEAGLVPNGFYAACDRLGILVWLVGVEKEDIPRASHPSLILVSGENPGSRLKADVMVVDAPSPLPLILEKRLWQDFPNNFSGIHSANYRQNPPTLKQLGEKKGKLSAEFLTELMGSKKQANSYLNQLKDDFGKVGTYEALRAVLTLQEMQAVHRYIGMSRSAKPKCRGMVPLELVGTGASLPALQSPNGSKTAAAFQARRDLRPYFIFSSLQGDTLRVFAGQDTSASFGGNLHLKISDFKGITIWERTTPLRMSKEGSREVFRSSASFLLRDFPANAAVLNASLEHNGASLAADKLYFVPVREQKLSAESLVWGDLEAIGDDQYRIEVRATELVRQLTLPDLSTGGSWSDNYLDLLAGESKTLTWTPSGQEAPLKSRLKEASHLGQLLK